MCLFRTFLIAGLIMTSASPALANGMSVRVCNRGDVAVSAALAYEDSDLTSTYWVADGWFTIPLNRCMTLHDASRDVCSDDTRYFTPCARVRIAYVFTDSTGVRGTADIRDSRFDPGGETMCVTTVAFKERRSAPNSGCSRPGWFLVPAAAKIDTYTGDGPYRKFRDFQGTTLDVALSSHDRARPFPGAEAGGAVQGPGTADEFVKLLRVAMNALPTSEETHGPGWVVQLKPGYRWVHVCASRQVVARESLSNSSTPRAKAITNSVRQLLASRGKGETGFRVSDLGGAVALEPFDGKTENCVRRGDLQYKLQSAETQR